MSENSDATPRRILLARPAPCTMIRSMTGDRSGSAPDDFADGSWATETLPLSVRKELLERELKKLGFRKAGVPGAGHEGGTAQQQQQPQGSSSHPQADGSKSGEHAD
jgi:hypothetical protein